MISKGIEIYKNRGLGGLLTKIMIFPFRFSWYKLGIRTWWLGDHWILGKYVEWVYGDTIKIDGLKFFIGTPLITTALKCRFIMNRYESGERLMIQQFLDPNRPVIELGGSIGVISCLANKKLTDPTKHVVIEANPGLIHVLEKNRDLNGCKFEIINKAFGYGQELEFYLHDKFIVGSLERKTGKSVRIGAVSLQHLLEKSGWNQVTLLCDIEGTEIDLIQNEIEIIKKKVSMILMEFHPGSISTKEDIAKAKETLRAGGFEIIYDDHRHQCVFKNTRL